MAIGLSGSNGGIGRVYIKIMKEDIHAGAEKYKRLKEDIPKDGTPEQMKANDEIRDAYRETANTLFHLYTQIRTLEEKIEDGSRI